MLEELWQVVNHCHIHSIEEARDMPVAVRKWWIDRTSKENAKKEGRAPQAGPPPRQKEQK